MMIGETRRHHQIDVPPWQESYSPTTVRISSPASSPPLQSNSGGAGSNHLPNSPTYYDAVLASLRRYLLADAVDKESSPAAATVDYSSEVDFLSGEYDDDFFMYDFKVRKCTRARAHDWTECPFAHPGEKARRRDPRKFSYSGTACSEFRKGGCKKGDGCEFAHGVFECWLHPTRFRTQACKDGPGCKRRVCFFAHTPDQLRTGPGLGSPRGSGLVSVSEDSAINTPSVGDLMASIRNLQLNKVKSMPNSWGSHPMHVNGSPVFGSPRGVGTPTAISRAGFFSLPTTPTRPRIGYWDNQDIGEEDEQPVMERVESGRELRARMFEKLSKENPLDGSGSPLSTSAPGSSPDFGWVCDLIE
ncbi:zinc finger CCCH domain-containing protein 20-like isoform X1 [Chenopodium quinoa]|uniref:C3H1-type domain-containing protein n=2 Tax=Chenopodium quinoa TaxID=63459 RepID=A0A803MPR5_CHEQI|nr:zinc finger CCCH domain-containing protein 20-like isoform X1 [Chenopodium quinoa]